MEVQQAGVRTGAQDGYSWALVQATSGETQFLKMCNKALGAVAAADGVFAARPGRRTDL